MDCRSALDILDAVPASMVEEVAAEDPRVARALDHVRAHADCAERLARRRAFDGAVARAMHDVAVPSDLEARLLSNLGVEAATVAAPPPRRIRARLAAAVLSACLLVAAGLWVAWPASEPLPTYETFRERIVDVVHSDGEFAAFDRSFLAELPGSGWKGGPVRVEEAPRGLQLDDDPEHDAAAYPFRVQARGRIVTGVLAVVPLDTLQNAPEARFFDSSRVVYSRRSATVSWAERGNLYVCVVHGGGDSVDVLEQALFATPVT